MNAVARHCLLLLAATFVTLPAAAAEIEDFGRLPEFEAAAVSDDGEKTALLVTVDGERLVLIRQGEKFVSKLTVGDEKVRDIVWAGNDHLLVATSQTETLAGFNVDQAEFVRMLVLSTDGTPARTVFAKQKKIFSSVFGIYGVRIVGGTPYLFVGGIPLEEDKYAAVKEYTFRGGKPQLFRVNLKNMDAKRIDDDGFIRGRRSWLIGADGTIAAKLDLERSSGDFEIKNSTGATLVSGNRPDGRIQLAGLSNDGASLIYWILDEEQDRTVYMQVPLAGGATGDVVTEAPIQRMFWDRRTARMLGYLKRNSEPNDPDRRVFFDPGVDARIRKVARAFPKLNNRIEDWTGDFGRVIVRTNGNGDSGSWFNVDLDNLSASALGYERMAVTPEKVGKISTITYQAADGLEIEAILTLPPGRAPDNLPVVVFPHGGPTSRDEAVFDWWAQAVAHRGYAVLQPNFRGSTNRDRAFIRAGYGEWGRKMQTDLSDGLTHLAEQGIIDPSRACIMGASYGGYAAMAGVTLQQGLYRCAVSFAGVSDLTRMVRTDILESGRDPMVKRILKEQIGQGRELKDISPRRFADQADAPVLLIHGKDDIVVPFEQSFIMADALKDAGKPYELLSLDGEDHWLSRSETRVEMLRAAIEFLEKHNPPG